MFDLSKAMDLKKEMEAMQAKLDNITVEGEAGDGKYKVVVTVSANKNLKNIYISEELFSSGDKEHLEDLITIAFNRALEKAQSVAETESRAAALGGGLSGLFGG